MLKTSYACPRAASVAFSCEARSRSAFMIARTELVPVACVNSRPLCLWETSSATAGTAAAMTTVPAANAQAMHVVATSPRGATTNASAAATSCSF